MNNKLRLFFLLTLLLCSFTMFAQSKHKKKKHFNPGQNKTGIAKFRKLIKKEIFYAKDEFSAFEDGFNLNCNTGFTFSRSQFWTMCSKLGINGPCNQAGDTCYSIRIFPAYNSRDMYLVFIGESFAIENEERTRLMRKKSYFKLISTGDPAAPSDLQEVKPSTSLYATLIEDIKNYSANLSEFNVFNVKSLSINIDDFMNMETALDNAIPQQQNKKYYIRLRPAYNANTLSDNKLYFTANEEEVTESAGTVTQRVLFEDVNLHPWYNHMNPCPDKCPINGFDLKIAEITAYRRKFAKLKANVIKKS